MYWSILVAYLLRSQTGVMHHVLGYSARTGVIAGGLAAEAALNFGLNLWLIPIHGKIALLVAAAAALWFGGGVPAVDRRRILGRAALG